MDIREYCEILAYLCSKRQVLHVFCWLIFTQCQSHDFVAPNEESSHIRSIEETIEIRPARFPLLPDFLHLSCSYVLHREYIDIVVILQLLVNIVYQLFLALLAFGGRLGEAHWKIIIGSRPEIILCTYSLSLCFRHRCETCPCCVSSDPGWVPPGQRNRKVQFNHWMNCNSKRRKTWEDTEHNSISGPVASVLNCNWFPGSF